MTENAAGREEIQQMLVDIDAGRKQLEALLQQSMAVERAVMELNGTLELLEQLKKSKKGSEVLVPIGGDSFVKASLDDTENVLAGVGANISVEKTVDEAVESVKNRAGQLGSTLVKLRENAVRINERVEELSRTVQELMQQAQKK